MSVGGLEFSIFSPTLGNSFLRAPIGVNWGSYWSSLELLLELYRNSNHEDEYEEEKQLFDSDTNMRGLMIMMIEKNKQIMSMMRRRKNNVNPNEEK